MHMKTVHDLPSLYFSPQVMMIGHIVALIRSCLRLIECSLSDVTTTAAVIFANWAPW